VYFEGISFHAGSESNTAAVDIMKSEGKGSYSWSVKSGPAPAGSADYKVNGKIKEFKEKLAVLLENEGNPGLGKSVMSLMKGERTVSKDAVMVAIYDDMKSSDPSIDHMTEDGFTRLKAVANRFYQLANKAVKLVSTGYSYLLVSPSDYKVVNPDEESSILQFKGTTQDKVTISSNPSYAMEFTKNEWSNSQPGLVGGKELRKLETKFNDATRNFVTALSDFRTDPGKPKANKLRRVTGTTVEVLKAWSEAAKQDETITKGNQNWQGPDTPQVQALTQLNAALEAIVPPAGTSKVAVEVYISKVNSAIESLESLGITLDSISSPSTPGSSWILPPSAQTGQLNAGRLRPGPLVSETLTLLEDLLSP
jgi:hypothetical protein